MIGGRKQLMTGLLLLTCLLQEQTHGYTVQPRPKRAVFDIIPSLASSTEPALEGTRCLCENGSPDCVLDFKGRCTAVLNLADVDRSTAATSRDSNNRRRASERHVKRRLTSLVMRWIRMKDAESRLLAELNL